MQAFQQQHVACNELAVRFRRFKVSGALSRELETVWCARARFQITFRRVRILQRWFRLHMEIRLLKLQQPSAKQPRYASRKEVLKSDYLPWRNAPLSELQGVRYQGADSYS